MKIIDVIAKYWSIILFIAGLCFHIIWTYFRVGSHDLRLEKVEGKQAEHEKSLDTFREDIKVDVKEIKTSLIFIREAMNRK